jgi:hypothetical protein
MAEIAAMLAQANTLLDTARKSRVPRRTIDQAARTIATVNADVQKVGEAMKADDYLTARPALDGIKERITEAIMALDAALAPRRRR